MAEEKAEWRVILENWRDRASQSMIEEMIEALDANIRTLYRWIKGPSKPDSRRKILILEQHIPEIGPALKEAFPQYYETTQNVVLRAVAPFYARVHEAYAKTDEALILRTVTNMVLDLLVRHLDAEDIGCVAMLGQLSKKLGEEQAKKPDGENATHFVMHAWSAHGTGVWFEEQAEGSYAVGYDGLCALAVQSGQPSFYPRDRDVLAWSCAQEKMYHLNMIKSAAAYPIQREGKTAGVVFIASTHRPFFTKLRTEIINHYAFMMQCAFHDGDFYRLETIKLEKIMPSFAPDLSAISTEELQAELTRRNNELLEQTSSAIAEEI